MTLPVLFTKKKDIRTHEMIPDMRFIHRRKRETIEDDPEIEKKYSSKSVFFFVFFFLFHIKAQSLKSLLCVYAATYNA